MVRDLETKHSYPIAGTLRVGKKNGNRPTSLNYFTVHEDSHTTDDVIKRFNSTFGNKPREIIIKFLSNEPFQVDYLRYAKSGLQCIGDGERASYKNKDNKKWCECECSKDCKYRGNECKLTGRLDFIIKDINIGGLWRFQTKSYNTITNFWRTLNFLKCMNHDITKSYFKLIVEENVINVGGETRKFVTLNLRELIDKEEIIKKYEKNILEKEISILKKEEVEKASIITEQDENIDSNLNNEETNKISNNQENNIDEFEKCLSLVEVHDFVIKDKVYKEATFCDMNNQLIKLLVHPNILEEVITWEIGSAIIPISIIEKNEYKTLAKYKDLGIIKK